MSLDEKAAAFGDGNMGGTSVALMLAGLNEEYFLFLDELDIVGSDLYLLFNDVCERNIEHLGVLLVVTRSGALGLSRERLIHAANNRGDGVDIAAVVAFSLEVGNQFRGIL